LKNIYVGNLSFGASEESLRSLFETYGTVGRVNIVTDRDTDQPRGFGFVEMANDGEGEKAIAAVNGRDLDGRTLSVNVARPKTGAFERRRWRLQSETLVNRISATAPVRMKPGTSAGWSHRNSTYTAWRRH
jgi:cold-inducible RNA-binding protein